MAEKLNFGRLAQRLWIVLITAGVVIGLDRWTKELVREAIPLYGAVTPYPALEGYFSLQHVNNYGAAFGIFQGGRIFFTVIAIVVSIGILYYAAQHLPIDQRFVRLLLGLEMGGAIGNIAGAFGDLFEGELDLEDADMKQKTGEWNGQKYIEGYNEAEKKAFMQMVIDERIMVIVAAENMSAWNFNWWWKRIDWKKLGQ